jgi:hypothetical protein
VELRIAVVTKAYSLACELVDVTVLPRPAVAHRLRPRPAANRLANPSANRLVALPLLAVTAADVVTAARLSNRLAA